MHSNVSEPNSLDNFHGMGASTDGSQPIPSKSEQAVLPSVGRTISSQGLRQPIFVFSGMGPQWWGMGQELYRTDATYRSVAEQIDQDYFSIAGFSILEEMLRDESHSRICSAPYAQTANLLVQLGLVEMFRCIGVIPGAVVGHSVGELASAYVASVLSLKEVLSISYQRSQLQSRCVGKGIMMAVGLNRTQMQEYLDNGAFDISIAAINGPSHVTVSGDRAHMHQLASQLDAANVVHKKLMVDVPYHSPMMDSILDELRERLNDLKPQFPRIPLYSTVTGTKINGISFGAEYWCDNVRNPVLFSDAIDQIMHDGFNVFLEIGPHPVLGSSIRDCCRESHREFRHIPTLRRSDSDSLQLKRTFMDLSMAGCILDNVERDPTVVGL